MESEAEYLLRRASEESLKAIASEKAAAADVHQELSVQYSIKAVALLAEDDPATNPSEN